MQPKAFVEKVPFIEGKFPIVISPYRGHRRSVGYHYHTFDTELVYVYSGSGFFFIKDRRYPLRNNLVFFIHKYDIHRYIPGKDSNFRDLVIIIFSIKIFKIILPYLKDIFGLFLKCDKKFPHSIQLKDEYVVESEILVKQLVKEAELKKHNYKEAIISILLRLFILIKRSITEIKDDSLREPENKIVTSVISYIDVNYKESLNIPKIAMNVFYSSNYISNIFKQNTGMSVKEYIINKRISEAKKLLIESDLKILGIAFDVGFSSINTFNVNFKKLTGLSPLKYRRFWILNSRK